MYTVYSIQYSIVYVHCHVYALICSFICEIEVFFKLGKKSCPCNHVCSHITRSNLAAVFLGWGIPHVCWQEHPTLLFCYKSIRTLSLENMICTFVLCTFVLRTSRTWKLGQQLLSQATRPTVHTNNMAAREVGVQSGRLGTMLQKL